MFSYTLFTSWSPRSLFSKSRVSLVTRRRFLFGVTAVVALLFGVFSLYSCGSGGNGGGGGGGGGSAQTTQMAGVVVAPNGQLAKASAPNFLQRLASLAGFPTEAIAQATTLVPVVGARVFVFAINAAGAPVGSPLATGTTDGNGAFVVNLPAGTALIPTLMIQAASQTASGPVAIGSPGVLNAPAVQSVMLVDPAGELGTRRIVTAGVSKFTPASAATYIGLLQTFLNLIPSLVGVSVANTITGIENDTTYQSEVLPVLLDIESSALVDQSVVSGLYQLVAYHARPEVGGALLKRSFGSGLVTFVPVTGTFSIEPLNDFGGQLLETITTPCARNFTLQAFVKLDFTTGLFFRTGGNRILLTGAGRATVLGFGNPSGTLAIFPQKDSDGELGFGIAIKLGSNLSPASIAGTFNFADYGSQLNQTAMVNNPWAAPVIPMNGAGTISFNSGAQPIGSTGADSSMSQLVTCTPNLSGSTSTAQMTVALGSPNSKVPFTVEPNGRVSSNAGSGQISPDSNVFVVIGHGPLTSNSVSSIAFSALVRQGTSLSTGSLNGTYEVVTFSDVFTTTAHLITQLMTGSAQFNGAGNEMLTTIQASTERTETCVLVNGGCTVSAVFNPTSAPVSESRSYNVTPEGILTITGGNLPAGATVRGGISPDGSFFITTLTVDNAPGGLSIRSIGFGMRRP